MAHVFISYQRQDIAFARALCSRISAAGMNVWMDDHLHAGEDWRITTDHAIREAFALVVIMTGAAKHSEYVTYEWACASGANIHVVPVLLERVRLHPRLDTLDHRDFSDPASQPFDLLIQDLRQLQNEYNSRRLTEDIPPPVKRAFEDLNATNTSDRLHALDRLAQMQHPTAFAALKQAVTTAVYDDVRLLAALYVIQRDPADCAIALPQLAAAITRSDANIDPDLYSDILVALRAMRDPDAVPGMIALHNRSDDHVRDIIHYAIEHMGATAVSQLMTLLHDGDDHVQQTVARLLIAIGDEAVPALIQALRANHTTVRFIAAHILGEIGSAEAMPAIIEAMDRSDTHLRRVLVYALGRMDDPRAIPALITRLDDRDMQTVATTVEALSRMEAHEAVPALCHVVDRPEPTLKLAAIQALGRLGDPRAVETLIAALDYSELQFQLTVIDALGRMRAEEAVPKLIAMLYTGEERAVRIAAEKALERVNNNAAIHALKRWRSPGTTRRLHSLDEQNDTESPSPWTPRAPFTASPSHKDTLFDDPAPDDLDLFSDSDDDPGILRDWLDFDL